MGLVDVQFQVPFQRKQCVAKVTFKIFDFFMNGPYVAEKQS